MSRWNLGNRLSRLNLCKLFDDQWSLLNLRH